MGLFDFLKFKKIENGDEDYDQEMFEKFGIKAKTVHKSKPSPYKPYLKKISEYSATEAEIKQVENAIHTNSFWEESFEWRISTVMTSRIEPKMENNKLWYITTVKCEQEVIIPAATIERAIIFKKLYQDFQMELWHEQGWASWTKKDKS
ncbi:MAG: hypothetical protein IPP51_13630 [Bacteroidetes bacterium]|nr:hypothetical protein [Bacteroidota bacterium]